MTRNYYNVYKNDALIAVSVPNQEVCVITGIKCTSDIANYAKSGYLYKKTYRIEIAKQVEEVPKEKPLVRQAESNSAFDEMLISKWNRMREAAEILKEKRGKIVTTKKNGKLVRYVEVFK